MESGRGCPYGCDFCTVTGFFGDSIRFRSNESVITELLAIKARAARDRGEIAVFFIDDNFAINIKRTKALLRDIIARGAAIPWIAQISVNLLRDEELVDLIAKSGGRWIFIGLESIDGENLAQVSKGFNKPAEYTDALNRLAARGIYAITSFIFGMDGDRAGVSKRTLEAIESWPPGLPVFGLLTPYPATPLYDRLLNEKRLTRPRHWLDFRPFRMAFTPKNISIDQAELEVHEAWSRSYDARAVALALDKIQHRPLRERTILLFARLVFRGIYFPQTRPSAWIKLVFKQRSNIIRVLREAMAAKRNPDRNEPSLAAVKVPGGS
jgi:radical SAM superfamily enzyme YgiQ (UPF0313 family)